MIILGIEASCDDTAVALVKNGKKIMGSLVASQIKIHKKFGGIVPEIASRKHLETILPLIDKLLKQTNLTKADIDAVAVTNKPGLLGSLLIGVNTAKTLAYLWGKPLIKVDHLIGHIYSAFLTTGLPKKFPVLALIVSGGHTELVLMKGKNKFKSVGRTRDDAVGEAFDKAAKLMGLGYPGGPAISKIAKEGDAPKLPRPMFAQGLDMSFSGLKTALFLLVNKFKAESLAFEFQEAVVDVLNIKTRRAIRQYKLEALVLAGGVAANKRLREELEQTAKEFKIKYYLPELKYCMDNAAMVALAAYYLRDNQNNKWYDIEVTTNSILLC